MVSSEHPAIAEASQDVNRAIRRAPIVMEHCRKSSPE
jgi:hypothetical protein